jgi:hypothetical protein
MWTFGTLCGHLVHYVDIWYIFSRFGIFTGKNLATLVSMFTLHRPKLLSSEGKLLDLFSLEVNASLSKKVVIQLILQETLPYPAVEQDHT